MWNSKKSDELYGISSWGSGYFKVNSGGHIEVTPNGGKSSLNLHCLVEELKERGIRLPMLLWFPDIIKARIDLLNNCFKKSIKEYGYKNNYLGVYPIKVNQQRHVVEEILRCGRPHRLGLECGSKPEFLISLALMDTEDALIICNGFKDKAYVEKALLSQNIGKNTLIVVDRFDELEIIISSSKKLNIKPRIGFRCKLNSPGSGRWMESSGEKSKFGLTPSEIVNGVQKLKNHNLLDALELLHFHIGSQIPSIQSIKTSMREGARFFTEIYKMGAPLRFIDVGGGLGVDYDGTKHTESSINYSEQEYANDVVSIIQSSCDEESIPHPEIISESGRATVAHGSALIFEVLGKNKVNGKVNMTLSKEDPLIIQELIEIHNNLNKDNFNECYNDLISKKQDILQMFSYGSISLEHRSRAEDLCANLSQKILNLTENIEDAENIFFALEKKLPEPYFCNFSIFQSIPDSWALGQHFPFAPLQRLHEKPTEKAIIVDLTCDSDGKVDHFIDSESGEKQSHIPIHKIKTGEPYYMAAFLTGAYQEILGDLHNLFGDTDIVHVSIKKNSYTIDHFIEGDSISDVLSYVEYSKADLLERIRKQTEDGILKGKTSHKEAKLLTKHYEDGLAGYTYLEQNIDSENK